MVQRGDYQDTLSRFGDCAVEYHKLLKYLENKRFWRRESDLRLKNSFFNIFKLLDQVVFFQGLFRDLFAKILTFYLAKLYSIRPLDILNFYFANNDLTPKSFQAQLS